MRFFAERGLDTDVSDVWAELSNQSDAARTAATGHDGRQYLVPFVTYPWVLVHRHSVWQQAGYSAPQTYEQLVALAERCAPTAWSRLPSPTVRAFTDHNVLAAAAVLVALPTLILFLLGRRHLKRGLTLGSTTGWRPRQARR